MRRLSEPFTDDDGFPPISAQLIRELSRVYPHRPPLPDSTERDDVYHAGQRSVVVFLKQQRKRQQEIAKGGRGYEETNEQT